MKKLLFAAAIGTMTLATPALADGHGEHDTRAALEQAVAAEWRGEQRERDQYRNPVETIEFFRIKPGMTVADYVPGSWYAKILIPYLGEDGKFIGMIRTFSTSSPENQEGQRVFPERYPRLIKEDMAEAGIEGGSTVEAISTHFIPEKYEGTVDRLLVMRMMHNLYRRDLAYEELSNFRKLLKDDGLLGIVQHRAKAGAPHSYADGNNGYMRQDDVIKLIEAHGFELVATSEVNANPKDPANHDGGVWQILPNLNSESEELRKIGESDRMTLLFKKRL